MGSSSEAKIHVHVCAKLDLLAEHNVVVVVVVVDVVVVVAVSCNKGCHWHMCSKKTFSALPANKVRCVSILSSDFRCLLAKGRAAQALANSSMVVNSCCRSQLNPNLVSS